MKTEQAQPEKASAQPENSEKQLTCERCGNKTDAGTWLGFVYVGVECLTKADQEYIE
jgi:hypothetical protein